MPIGSPAFGPAGAPVAHPDAQALLHVAGDQLAAPTGGGWVTLTGTPLTRMDSSDYSSPTVSGYLYLTRIPMIGPVVEAIGLDPSFYQPFSIRFGLYRQRNGMPYELAYDCGVANTHGDRAYDEANAFVYPHYAASEGDVLWAGWTANGPDVPDMWTARSFSYEGGGYISFPTVFDPTLTPFDDYFAWDSYAEYYDPAGASSSDRGTWQYQLFGAADIMSEAAAPATGFVYLPKNDDGSYGLKGTLPDLLPTVCGVKTDGDAPDGYYGFGPDGYQEPLVENFRALVKLAN